jgi:Na+-transporting NADH:ubiquinone oxidoreductase subunit C
VSNKDSVSRTLLIALALCLVCSVIVSMAAVMLKPAQEANKTLDKKRNILAAAGMLDESKGIDEQFALISSRVVDLRTGKFTDDVDPEKYNQKKAAKDPAQSEALGAQRDKAKIRRRENYAVVYLVEPRPGEFDKVILPIRGYGLWSTLYGFVALESDANTIAGLGFYEHGETPGLGGEVDNPRWKSLWPGKQVYRNNSVEIGLTKGVVNTRGANAPWQVDGLSGATLTSRGVTNLVRFWLGEDGFQAFLTNLKSGEA